MKKRLLYKLLLQEHRPSFELTYRFSIILLCLLWLLPDSASAQWTRKQDATYDRGEMKTILYKNKIYHFNGFGVWPNVEPTNEVYDPATDTWTLLAPMPEGKSVTHEGRLVVDGNVWCIGGRLVSTQGPLTSEVWIYNIAEDRWSPGPELLDPATGQPILWGGGGAELVGRTLHVFGGFIVNPCNNDQDKYHLTLDVDKWLASPQQTTWENNLTPMPIKRNHISSTVFKGRIYVIGGQFGHDCGGGQDQRYSHMYDPLTDTWTRLTDLPTVRSHCEASIFPVDGKIYIAGGDGATDKVTILNPDANNGLGSWANASYELPVNPYTNTNSYIGISAKVVGDMFVASCGKIGNTDPRRETYTRPFTRNIPYAFGFGASCFSKTLEPDQKAVLKNLLYTIEGEKGYALSSNAAWLKVTKNATGMAIRTAVDIEATIDATGLAPGTYTATVTATGTGTGPTFTSASFCVNLTVAGEGTVQNSVRVNAGGGEMTAYGETFAADQYFSGDGKVYTNTSASIAGTTDDALYQSERSTLQDLQSFSYNIPVANGRHLVRLHFAEIYFGATGGGPGGTGKRVFSVTAEGAPFSGLTNYDIIADVGSMTAVTKEMEVEVTDGTLNLNFSASVNQPKVSAIEVLELAAGNLPPIADAGADQFVTLPADQATLTGSGSDPEDGANVTFSWEQTSGPNQATIAAPTAATTEVSGIVEGDYTFMLTVADTEGSQSTATVNVVVRAAAITYTLTVNTAGNGSVAPGSGIYEAGEVVSLTATPASGYSFAGWSGAVTGTVNPISVTMDGDKSVTATFEETPTASSTLVNVGGASYTDTGGRTWSADAYGSGGVTSIKSFDVAGTTDDPLYLSYRFASNGAPFSYNVPVREAGSYTVKLHLMEPYFKRAGARVFSVDLEGTRVLSNYDLYAQQGFGRAVVLSYQGVSVTDGSLTILFTSAINNAVVSGIEVVKDGAAPVSYTLAVNVAGNGSVSKSPNQSSYLSGTNVELTANPATGYRFTGWSGDASGTANPVTITMDRNKSVTATFEVVSTQSSVLVNAGGAGYTDTGGRVWGADAYFTGGVTSSKSFNVGGTTDDPLYLSYRFASNGAAFSYNIPASASGSYTVKLHLMEPYFRSSGARRFNVDLEGVRVLSSYDLYALYGFGQAVVLTFDGVLVTDGTLDVLFSSVTNNAIISGIEVTQALSASTTAGMEARQETEPGSSLIVYPNPNPGDLLYVEMKGFHKQEALTLLLYDVTGRILQSETILTDDAGALRQELLFSEHLPKGVYMVQVQGRSARRQNRFVVQ